MVDFGDVSTTTPTSLDGQNALFNARKQTGVPEEIYFRSNQMQSAHIMALVCCRQCWYTWHAIVYLFYLSTFVQYSFRFKLRVYRLSYNNVFHSVDFLSFLGHIVVQCVTPFLIHHQHLFNIGMRMARILLSSYFMQDQLIQYQCSRLEKQLSALKMKRKLLLEGAAVSVSLNELVSDELLEAAEGLLVPDRCPSVEHRSDESVKSDNSQNDGVSFQYLL